MDPVALARRLRESWWRLVDPRRVSERRGERVVFRHLERAGSFEGVSGGRILEIGPKHGEDTRLLAGLAPSELVLVDLPDKSRQVASWISELGASIPVEHLEGNLLYMPREKLDALGRFDLVWCLGVLYHNVEQLRLLRALFRLTAPNGRLVLESATTRTHHLQQENVVEVHWPETYRGLPTITHLPSRRAIESWLAMVGFSDIELRDVYSRELAWQRAVFTARRSEDASAHPGYGAIEGNPDYVTGEAT